MRISDWSSDVCSSDLPLRAFVPLCESSFSFSFAPSRETKMAPSAQPNLTLTSIARSIARMTAFDDWRTRSPSYDETHDALAQSVRRFVAREIAPHIDRWEAEGELPRELPRKDRKSVGEGKSGSE